MTPKVFLFPWYCRLIGLVITFFAAGMIGFLAVSDTDFSGWPAVLEDPDVLRYAALLMPGLFLVAFSREKVEDEFLNTLRLSSVFLSLGAHAVFFLAFSFSGATEALIRFPALLLMDSVLLVYILLFYIRKL